jgi:predicted transport protein
MKTGVKELGAKSVSVEKSLQTLIERDMEAFFGVRFLASEYPTGKVHGGRIDSLGLDENGCPVIFEYKRATNENVINQGLFYLDWLMDHRAEFKLLVMDKFGKKAAGEIEWLTPRLVCVAGDFKKYDEYAVQQINRNIELVRYRRYGKELILFELVNATTADTSGGGNGPKQQYKTVGEQLSEASEDIQDRFEAIKAFMLELGDDVQMKELKFYFAFKRIKNFACVEIHKKVGSVLVYLKVDPASIKLEKGFSRDVRKIGHFGTGDLEVTIRSDDDFEKTKALILKSYESS